MRRRQILAAGSAGLLTGCIALSTGDTETSGTNEYSFAGLAVIAHPVSVENQPLELTAEVRSDGGIITDNPTTVRDAIDEVVLAIHEGLSPHTPYTVTLRTPATSREIATDRLRRDTDESLAGETVGYVFWLRDSHLSFQPRIVKDDWPTSGVDLFANSGNALSF
jgi:hypothetical protein